MTCWIQQLSPELQTLLIEELKLEKEWNSVQRIIGMNQDVDLPPLIHDANLWARSYHQEPPSARPIAPPTEPKKLDWGTIDWNTTDQGPKTD